MIQRDYMLIDPQEIEVDMPCSKPRIDELKQSIEQMGIIQPITLWLQGMRVIDGFHRTVAAQQLGLKEVPAIVVDCSAEAFWDARIQSAKQHADIADTRLLEWIYQSWGESELGQMRTRYELAEYVYEHRLDTPLTVSSLSDETINILGNTASEDDFSQWFKTKCGVWGRSWADVARILLLKEGANFSGFHNFDPREIIPELSLAEATAASSLRWAADKHTIRSDDIHDLLDKFSLGEVVNPTEFVHKRRLAEQERADEKERAKFRLELEQKKQFDATEQGRKVKRKEQMDSVAAGMERVLNSVYFLCHWDQPFTLEEAITENKRVKAQADLLAAFCTEFWNMAGQHLSGDALAIENKALREENQRLQWRAEAYDREKAAKLDKKAKKALVLSSTDIEHLPQGLQA